MNLPRGVDSSAWLVATIPRLLCFCVASCGHGMATTAADFVGRASCASATCHGGIAGQGPAWHSALRTWESSDFSHAQAGRLLLDQQSQQIVARLNGWSNASPRSPAEYRQTLAEKCVSCHAPISVMRTAEPSDVPRAWEQQIADGVSCEACHGAATRWIAGHTLKTWNSLSDQAAGAGMVATKRWADRTQTCLKCHVGSRATDSVARDVNHDLIAAGHPPLQFDMGLYHTRLPAHWEVPTNKVLQSSPDPSLDAREAGRPGLPILFEQPERQEVDVAQLVTLAAAARLSLDRHSISSHSDAVPDPELSDFDCQACHHDLSLARVRGGQPTAGSPRWNPWITGKAAIEWKAIELAPDQLRLGDAELWEKLRLVERLARETAGKTAFAVEPSSPSLGTGEQP